MRVWYDRDAVVPIVMFANIISNVILSQAGNYRLPDTLCRIAFCLIYFLKMLLYARITYSRHIF